MVLGFGLAARPPLPRRQRRATVTQLSPLPASPLQAQAVAELQESLNIVELNALARDPDLIASVLDPDLMHGLEQLMDSTTTTTTTVDSEQLVRMAG